MKLLHGAFSIIFVIMAVLQYNDPDPHVWGIYYLLAAVGAGFCAVGRGCRPLAWICIGASFIFLLQTAPGLSANFYHPEGPAIGSMSDARPEIEQTREFGGAMVVLIWALLAIAGRITSTITFQSSNVQSSPQ